MDRVDLRRAGDRFLTRTDWLESWHSFSFGPHYDPANTGFGALVVNNDDRVVAGAGFDLHPHRDMEIVTWVLAGSLTHRDSAGNAGVIVPGLAQRMSAGRGIRHSERNDAWTLTGNEPHTDPAHFVQMWVRPDEPGGEPGYAQLDVTTALARPDWVPVASGRAGQQAAVRIAASGAALHAVRLPADAHVALPAAPRVHLFVALGTAELEGAGPLAAGDAVRLTGSEGRRITATTDSELLAWELH